jgi:hypothetical protein
LFIFQGPLIQRKPSSYEKLTSDSVSINFEFASVINLFTSSLTSDGPSQDPELGATDRPTVQEHMSTTQNRLETLPLSDVTERTAPVTTSITSSNSSSGDGSTGSGVRTTKYTGHDSTDARNNRTSVCVFRKTEPRIFDVVVFLTVDMAISALALILGGIRFVFW